MVSYSAIEIRPAESLKGISQVCAFCDIDTFDRERTAAL
jgi:hypothetical protein